MNDSDFISTKNKAMIWQLLIEANAFVNIPEHYFETIKNMYEKFIDEISQLSNMSLKEKNKLIMSKMFENIKYYANHTVQKPLEEVKIRVEEQFKNKQEEFIQLVNHNKPKDVSFNDEVDQPFNNEELNAKLNQLIANRSYDVETNTDLSDNNINDNVPLPKKEIKDEKKVSFLPTSESILSKLKPLEKIEDFSDKKDINKDIYEILQTISMNLQLTLKNQDLIMNLINKNNINQ